MTKIMLLSFFLISFLLACDTQIGKTEYLGKIMNVGETMETHYKPVGVKPVILVPVHDYYYIIDLNTGEKIKFDKYKFKIKPEVGQDLYREKVTVKYAPDYYNYFTR